MMSVVKKQVEIVRIGPADYAAFSALLEWRRTGREGVETTRYQTEQLQQFMQQYRVLDSDMFFIYAAKVDGNLVGYINAIIIPKPEPRLGTMYIDELWTAPQYRGMGIAGQLLAVVTRLAKQLNLWRVRLYVSTDNDAARTCYRKAGFVEKGDCLFCEVDVAEIN